MAAESVLFSLLRAAVCEEAADQSIVNTCTPDMLSEVYALAGTHDLAHLVSRALEKMGHPSGEVPAAFKTAKEHAVFRYLRQDFEYGKICRILEKEKIAYIPLKGIVLREYYPEPWMRTSTDIDILIHAEDLERAVQAMERQLGYHRKGKSGHDVSLYSPSGTRLELHYDMIEASVSEASQKVLHGIWNKAIPWGLDSCRYMMPDELFYFYHMAHMAKHIRNGGCGIRFFLDIRIMNQRMSFDPAKRKSLLAAGRLLRFAGAVEKLTRIWFCGEKMDADSQRLARYVLVGGIYGSSRNKATLSDAGKTYPLSRLLIPYEDLKYYYPVLETSPWLTPVFQVARWLRLLRGIGNSLRAAQIRQKTPTEEMDTTSRLMRYLGI